MEEEDLKFDRLEEERNPQHVVPMMHIILICRLTRTIFLEEKFLSLAISGGLLYLIHEVSKNKLILNPIIRFGLTYLFVMELFATYSSLEKIANFLLSVSG